MNLNKETNELIIKIVEDGKNFAYSFSYYALIPLLLKLYGVAANRRDYSKKILHDKLYGSLKRLHSGDNIIFSNGLELDGKDKKYLVNNILIIVVELTNSLVNSLNNNEKQDYKLLNDLLVALHIYLNVDCYAHIDLRKHKPQKIKVDDETYLNLINSLLVNLQDILCYICSVKNINIAFTKSGNVAYTCLSESEQIFTPGD